MHLFSPYNSGSRSQKSLSISSAASISAVVTSLCKRMCTAQTNDANIAMEDRREGEESSTKASFEALMLSYAWLLNVVVN